MRLHVARQILKQAGLELLEVFGARRGGRKGIPEAAERRGLIFIADLAALGEQRRVRPARGGQRDRRGQRRGGGGGGGTRSAKALSVSGETAGRVPDGGPARAGETFVVGRVPEGGVIVGAAVSVSGAVGAAGESRK